MSGKKGSPPTPPDDQRIDMAFAPSAAELIVVAEPALHRRTAGGRLAPAAPDAAGALEAVLRESGATIRPLFDFSASRAMRAAIDEVTSAERAAAAPELSMYFKVDAPDSDLDRLAARLRTLPSVAAAYVKPPTYPAVRTLTPPSNAAVHSDTSDMADRSATQMNAMMPAAEEAPPATPDFAIRQSYLLAAPGGIDAVYASTVPGGRGAGVRIIDIEGAWRFTHEDLMQNQGGVVAGTPSADIGWRNHGTAVMGEIGGDINGLGITGISPDANTRAISIFGGAGSASSIRRAADLLSPGDIILIELHRPGPAATGVGQVGFIAVEWWPDDYDAIRYAVGRGVIVVEAAGNGAVNLDDPLYDRPGSGFPASWSNPFRRNARDSGAILVGAGAPPQGTHGRDHGPDRSRLDFSNFGSAVDAQGWGREVTTTGYGDLQGGSNEDFWYTDQFSGTSSASPIIVGALACAQGNRRARATTLLTPATARSLLRSTGSPQQDAPGRPATQRIGNRPNLRQMLNSGSPVALTVPLFRYWNPNNTDHFYTTNFAELGSGRYGWALEGTQCFVASQSQPGLAPLYRYWNPGIGDHFYTTNFSELGNGRYGWSLEGVQCYVYTAPAANRAPLFRYWNAAIGDHFYTTAWTELGGGRYGWQYEGIQCYVATSIRPPEAPDAGESATGADAAEPTHGSFTTVQAAPDIGAIAPVPLSFSVATTVASNVTPSSFLTTADSSQETPTAVPASFTIARDRKSRSRSITISFDDGAD